MAQPGVRSPSRSSDRPLVFLSYSRRDKVKIDELHHDLEARGIEVWVDHTDLVGTATWTAEIVAAIQRSDAMVLVLSRSSVDSDHVAREVALGGQADRPIFPVRLELVDAPDDLAYYLAGRQRYDAYGERRPAELDRLARAIVGSTTEGLDAPTASRARRSRRGRSWSTPRRPSGADADHPPALGCLVLLGLLVGLAVAALVVTSVLTASFPPSVDDINGDVECDDGRLEVLSASPDLLRVQLINDSDVPIEVTSWSADLDEVGGEDFWVVTRGFEAGGVDEIVAGAPVVGRIEIRAPRPSGTMEVVVEASDLRQGGGIFNRCSIRTRTTVTFG